ncbi:hypothetical protein [Phenylobacterium sp.]|uniref:hypothetical protein n=1 Tax=Phenylobacterium sp. TaxID=1871053 RepID=UPI002FE1C4DE
MTLRPAALGALAALVLAPAAFAQPAALPVDVETEVNGVPVACTGVGQTRLDPKWLAYPVRVEVSNALNEYLVGSEVTIRDRAGREVLSASCDAPWLLLKLPAGAYRIEGRIAGSPAKPRTAPFSPPAAGQMRLVLQFPDA